MIAIDNILVAEAVVQEHFVCNLGVCKGACCVQGDTGARVEPDELKTLEAIYPAVEPFITEEGKEAVSKQGTHVTDGTGMHRTPLAHNGACAYVTYENGIVKCGIEKAYEAGKIDFPKPIWCHLYPIRIEKHDGYEAVNFDMWDICHPACTHGQKLKVRVFEFLQGALIRKYGKEFYETLKSAADYSGSNK